MTDLFDALRSQNRDPRHWPGESFLRRLDPHLSPGEMPSEVRQLFGLLGSANDMKRLKAEVTSYGRLRGLLEILAARPSYHSEEGLGLGDRAGVGSLGAIMGIPFALDLSVAIRDGRLPRDAPKMFFVDGAKDLLAPRLKDLVLTNLFSRREAKASDPLAARSHGNHFNLPYRPILRAITIDDWIRFHGDPSFRERFVRTLQAEIEARVPRGLIWWARRQFSTPAAIAGTGEAAYQRIVDDAMQATRAATGPNP